MHQTRRDLLLGLDLGTSAVKAILIDASSTTVAVGSAPCAVSTPRPLWSEQDPSEWWRAARGAVAQALGLAATTLRASPAALSARIAGVGIAGQMHGLVALDARLNVVRPCILWNDQRSGDQCAELETRLGLPMLLRHTGNRVYAGFTLPKLLWMREHEPEAFARVRHVLLPKDWLRFRLTGTLAHDVSDASGTSLFDPGRRAWSAEMLAATELPAAWLPPVHESIEVVGAIAGDAAEESGLRAGTPVVAGCSDQAAAAIGLGVVEEGECSATIGTSGVVFVARSRHAPDAEGRLHAFCHATPDRWHQMGVVLSAGGALRWYRDTLARDASAEADARGVDVYEIIAQRAAEAPAGCEGLTFLPYLAGERTPHADPLACGALIGLTLRHDHRAVARAVIEGVTFALHDCLDLVRSSGAAPSTIRLAGGGARSRFWRTLCADVFGSPVESWSRSEGGAVGAALLAGVGCGMHPSVVAACRTLPAPDERIEPTPVPALEEAVRRYRGLYPAVQGSRRADLSAHAPPAAPAAPAAPANPASADRGNRPATDQSQSATNGGRTSRPPAAFS